MGLGLYKKYRTLISYYNLSIFTIKKYFIGFDVANLFLQRVDKYSLKLILKQNKAQIGKDCDIETGLIFHNCKDYSNLSLGDNCHIGKNCFFDLRDKIVIRNNVVISMQCTFITHIDLSQSNISNTYKMSSDRITINNDCYIGACSKILKGVVLNEACFVSASSLVINNLESNKIYGGIPAKFIKDF